MLVAVFLLSVAMVAMGVAAVVFGAPIIQIERGTTMVLAGTAVATGGALLFGIGTAIQGLRRIERELVRARARALQSDIRPAEGLRLPAGARDDDREPDRLRPTLDIDIDDVEDRTPPPEAVPPERPQSAVVGRYASGENSYTMYADGSIDAETPAGPRRFSSLDELKTFAAGGGERRG